MGFSPHTMPEKQSESRLEDAIIRDGEVAPDAAPPENAWVAFERGRLSRRQALKKLGMTSAMATFALFSVDDLARMVGKAMEQRVADNKVAEQVAKEFQQAGIALAGGQGLYMNDPCSGTTSQDCNNCSSKRLSNCLRIYFKTCG